MTQEKADNKLVFNKSNLDKIPFAEPGKQLYYYDTKTTGFSLRVGANTKSYTVYARIKNGSPVRITLGKFTVLSVDQARELAIKKLQELNSGINPNAEVKKQKEVVAKEKEIQSIIIKKDIETVSWLLDQYEKEHLSKGKKEGKASKGTLRSMADTRLYFGKRIVTTLKNKDGVWYEDTQVELEDWLDRPLRSITKHDVLNRFKVYEVAKPSRKQKIFQPITRTHQIAFRFLRAAYNYYIPRAFFHNDEELSNPVDAIKTFGLWKNPNVRENIVDFETTEFLTWWRSVESYEFENGLVSDYLLFSLIQGGRSIDIAPLEWTQINLEKKLITYGDTKNGEDYYFPITKLAERILKRRKQHAGDSKYVFAYEHSKNGYIPQDCKYHFQVISKLSGKLISHHDLKRTFGSAASTLEINERVIDYCLKHTINDVNKHYFMREQKKITKALQSIEDFFLEKLTHFDAKINGKINIEIEGVAA